VSLHGLTFQTHRNQVDNLMYVYCTHNFALVVWIAKAAWTHLPPARGTHTTRNVRVTGKEHVTLLAGTVQLTKHARKHAERIAGTWVESDF
jgi:hypothetical protein